LAAAVVGHPISHSLSPVLHNAWIEALGLDAWYGRIDPGENGFEKLVASQRSEKAGFNITIPFKEQALALASPTAHREAETAKAHRG